MLLTVATPVTKVNTERLGGLQNFLFPSWQHKLGKQSIGELQDFGNKSKIGGGGGVHCI